MKNNQSGFTLIELILIVVTIVIALAGIAWVGFLITVGCHFLKKFW